MSEYTTFEYETDARMSRIPGMTTSSLRAMFNRIEELADKAKLNQPSEVLARFEAIQSEPAMVRAVINEATEQGLMSLRESGCSELLELAPHRFDEITRNAEKRLIQSQAKILNGHFRSALEEMGYELQSFRRKQRGLVSVQGKHADGTAITVEIEPERERAEVDMSGFEPGVCQRATKDFVDKMKKRGVYLIVRNKQRHDNSAGGSLTKKVNRLLFTDRQAETMGKQGYVQRLPQRQ